MKLNRTLTGLAAVGLLALTTLTANARDFFLNTYPVIGSLSNLIAGTGTVSSNSSANVAVLVPQNCNWSIAIPNTATNAIGNNSNTVYGFDFSDDSVSWTTNQPLQVTVAQAPVAMALTNFLSGVYQNYGGVEWMKLTKVTTSGTNIITTTKWELLAFQ